MNEQQFELHMEALERIRCGIIDVESEAQKISEAVNSASGNNASRAMPTDRDIEVCAMAIVHRVGESCKVDVPIRQLTNDGNTNFAIARIKTMLAQQA